MELMNVIKREEENGYENLVAQTEQDGKQVVVHLFRNNNLPFKVDYLVSHVYQGENLIWSFKQTGFDGLALIAKVDLDVVICLCERGRRGKLVEIFPISALLGKKHFSVNESADLKEAVAKKLGRNYELTANERFARSQQIQKQQIGAQAADQAKREERLRKRQEKVEGILSRKQIQAYTAGGDIRYGHPVLENEWTCLPKDTFCIKVQEILEDVVKMEPIEAFIVTRRTGKSARQKGKCVVYPYNPLTEKPFKMPVKIKTILVEIKDREGWKDDVYEVSIYLDAFTIDIARQAGLSGGTLVSSEEEYDGEKAVVYAVYPDRVDTVGKCDVCDVPQFA